MKKYFFMFCLLGLIDASYAGLKTLRWHSRANCGNNESITWHLGHSYKLLTKSIHSHCPDEDKDCVIKKEKCNFATGWEKTWRSAAVHWGEAAPGSGWNVLGIHYIKESDDNQPSLLGMTGVADCSIYDGWWDQD